jgi:hypothetical protein
MNIFQIALLVGAGVTALISWKVTHALLWIGLAGVNAVAGYLYLWRDLPHPTAFIFAADCLLCLAVHWLAKERYELWIFHAYQFSVLISLLRLAGVITNEYLYFTLLELVNWAVLLLISGTAILGKAGASGRFFLHPWRPYVLRIGNYLRSPRAKDHWSKVP